MERQRLLEIIPNLTLLITVLYFNEFIRYEIPLEVVIKILNQVDNYAVEPGYNDVGLCESSSVASDILWHQLIPRC